MIQALHISVLTSWDVASNSMIDIQYGEKKQKKKSFLLRLLVLIDKLLDQNKSSLAHGKKRSGTLFFFALLLHLLDSHFRAKGGPLCLSTGLQYFIRVRHRVERYSSVTPVNCFLTPSCFFLFSPVSLILHRGRVPK